MPNEIGLFSQYRPETIFAWYDAVAVTQQEFLRQAVALAGRLPDQRYMINLCRDRYHFALAFCATLINGSSNLLPPNRQHDIIVELASKYKAACCLVDGGSILDDIDCIDVKEGLDGGVNEALLHMPVIDADQIAAVVFTSGSTGEPTANRKQWRTLVGTTRLLSMRFFSNIIQMPNIIATVPAQHMYGLEMSVMMSLHGRGIMVSTHPFFPQEVADSLAHVPEPRCLVTTPVHMRAMIESGIEMPHVAKVISATAPLSKEMAARVEHVFDGSVEEIYGCTEAGSLASRRTANEDEWHMLHGMAVSGEYGQVTVSGPHLSETTSLQDHLEIVNTQTFRFLGRASDLVNVAGKRASLADLTHKLMCIDGIDDAIVFLPEESGKHVQRLAALVVSDLSDYEITHRLARLVDPVFIPRPLRKVSCLPRSETGKVLFDAVQEMIKIRP